MFDATNMLGAADPRHGKLDPACPIVLRDKPPLCPGADCVGSLGASLGEVISVARGLRLGVQRLAAGARHGTREVAAAAPAVQAPSAWLQEPNMGREKLLQQRLLCKQPSLGCRS